MLVMLKSLALEWLIRFVVLLLAVFCLIWFSTWIDGKSVEIWGLTQRVGPIAATYSMGWAIVLWREMGGDIVVSNRGCPPLIVYCFVLSLALVPTILCTMNQGKSQQTSTAGNKIALHSNDLMGQTSFIWTDQGAIRRQSGSVDMTFPELPRPPGKATEAGLNWSASIVWVVVLFGFISALGLPRARPNMGTTIILSTVAAFAGDLLGRIL